MSYLKVAGINHPSATTGGLAISSGGIVTGGGLDYITSSTFSAASTVSVDGCFTATHDNYYVIAYGSASAGATLCVRMRASATDATASDYNMQRDYVNGTGTTPLRSNSVAFYEAGNWGPAGDWNLLELTFMRPALAAATLFSGRANYAASGATPLLVDNVGYHTLTTAYDGFTLYPSTGSITGSVSVYGYKK